MVRDCNKRNMKENLPTFWKSKVTHAIALKQGKTTYSLLGESNSNESSVVELTEKEIISWMLNNHSHRDFILSDLIEHNLGDHFLSTEVESPLLTKDDQKNIGDIDLLLCPIERPELATAIEFKRIKVLTQENGEVKINRLEHNKSKGVKQIKQMRKFEFHKTYLGIIIEDDGRHIKGKGTIFKSANNERINDIYRITYDPNLDENAGVIFIRINQPTGDNINTRNNIETCIHRDAKCIKQSIETTLRIKQLIKEKIRTA